MTMSSMIARLFIALALLVLCTASTAQLVPEGKRPALNIVALDSMPLNIEVDMTNDCEINGDALFGTIFASLEQSDIGFVRADDEHDARLVLTIRIFGTEQNGCAAFIFIEVMQSLNTVLPYSLTAFDSDAALVRLDTYFGPTPSTGAEFESELLGFLGARLLEAWNVMRDEALP